MCGERVCVVVCMCGCVYVWLCMCGCVYVSPYNKGIHLLCYIVIQRRLKSFPIIGRNMIDFTSCYHKN